MRKITLAVFDMAGTTIDEDNVVYKTLQKAINLSGRKVELDFVLRHGAGKEKHQAIKDILEAMGEAGVESHAIFSEFKTLLEKAYLDLEVRPYQGVEALLLTLKTHHIKVVLNTGYDRSTAQLLLDKLRWEQGRHYDFCVTSDDVEQARPAADMILKAMELTGIKDSSLVLKAGDSISDIEEGKNAGCGLVIGVTTGAHNAEQLNSAVPSYVLNALNDLLEYINLS